MTEMLYSFNPSTYRRLAMETPLITEQELDRCRTALSENEGGHGLAYYSLKFPARELLDLVGNDELPQALRSKAAGWLGTLHGVHLTPPEREIVRSNTESYVNFLNGVRVMSLGAVSELYEPIRLGGQAETVEQWSFNLLAEISDFSHICATSAGRQLGILPTPQGEN